MRWNNGMGWGGMGAGGWVVMTIVMLAFWALVVAGVVALFRSGRPAPSKGVANSDTTPRPSAQNVLDERFARGEINEQEYQARRSVLTSTSIDEVEEIAAARTLADTDVGVVNELLKGLVSFRAQPGRLFICATNSVRTLDPAFLRHGRFDYVLPIGPPDADARRALWATYGTATEPGLALGDLADASAGFTPADIRHAGQRVAQRRLEAALSSGEPQGVTTSDYLAQIAVTRPTLTPEAIAEFEEDTAAHARV